MKPIDGLSQVVSDDVSEYIGHASKGERNPKKHFLVQLVTEVVDVSDKSNVEDGLQYPCEY